MIPLTEDLLDQIGQFVLLVYHPLLSVPIGGEEIIVRTFFCWPTDRFVVGILNRPEETHQYVTGKVKSKLDEFVQYNIKYTFLER